MLDTFRKVPRLAGSEAQAAALESAGEFDGGSSARPPR